MKNHYAILKDKKVIPVDLLTEMAVWHKNFEDRIVKRNEIDGVLISTVFLGINHGFSGKKDLWFETMIFGLEAIDEYQERYETYEEAEDGHDRAVASVMNILNGQKNEK